MPGWRHLGGPLPNLPWEKHALDTLAPASHAGDPTIPLGTLFQWLTVLIVKNFPLAEATGSSCN